LHRREHVPDRAGGGRWRSLGAGSGGGHIR
jgi:hypothetical protein